MGKTIKLKEKFYNVIKFMERAEECEQIADEFAIEFAIEFAKWCAVRDYYHIDKNTLEIVLVEIRCFFVWLVQLLLGIFFDKKKGKRIMIPKEKAIELVERFRLNVLDYEGCSINSHKAKQCVLIAVDEILMLYKREWDYDNQYWTEVKTEIEKL